MKYYILPASFFTVLPDQTEHGHYSAVQDACDCPDEPAVFGLRVAIRPEGVEHENSSHDQPIADTDRPDQAAFGLSLAGVVALLQQLFHRGGLRSGIDEREAGQRDKAQKQAHRADVHEI